jgi:AraC family transcriptional regulator
MLDLYDSSIIRTVTYLEDRLNEELTLDELAREAAFSKFHFSRIFKAITKDSVNEYIRKRRLTMAAKDLIETHIPIIQLAVTYGYSSQESFSRPFKSYFNITPQSYRKKGEHYHNLYIEPLTESILVIKREPIRKEVTILERPSFYIGGLSVKGNLNNHRISMLWNQFYEELSKQSIDPVTARCFGYESLDERNIPFYLAAVEWGNKDNLPAGWSGVLVPAQKYAVFTLENVIDQIGLAIEDIYRVHLPAMNVKPVKNFHYEYYDEAFAAQDLRFTLEVHIPIE